MSITGKRVMVYDAPVPITGKMEYRKKGVSIGMPGEDEYVIWQTAKEKIAEARGIVV